MARHKQKDEEAGAEGCGILNTRKRMWKDEEGKIVTKKPAIAIEAQKPKPPPQPQPHPQHEDPLQALADFALFAHHEEGAPISPPISHNASLSNSLDDHDSGIASAYPPTILDPNTLSTQTFSPVEQSFWSADLSQPDSDPFATTTFDDAPFDDIFNPDTASSFNNPFTTMNNYNWLFDMDLAQATQAQQQPAAHDPFPNFSFPNSTVPQPSHAFDLQLDHMTFDKPLSTDGQFGSLPSQRTDSVVHQSPTAPMITPPLSEQQVSEQKSPTEVLQATGPIAQQDARRKPKAPLNSPISDVERPMSMLQSSQSLPIIDELARQQILDLIDITQPTAPDGSIVMRDHPEKDAHQLAVCIHDVLRPQIFANAGFSSKPDLWVLQTILLVECFGKSRAGQKQHDMSHLFHGLLINLIRRSDCQTVRPPTLEDATDDLEDDWRTWVDAEQKKRLAFLCFMWDTQHAVLFCQSLCMSAFELRSNLPCDQSLWEADSAETWHQLRQKQPPPPLFLSCLKMYLHPNAAVVPKNLNNLSRLLLLHGLMSVAWDMQRRDQTSLGDPLSANPLGNWQSRLASSYIAWHADYDSFCTAYIARLPSQEHFLAKEFQVMRSATLSLYHSAHILLHTPFLDLQIYAGARHILGRHVARADYVRSQRIVKKWVVENIKEAGKAVSHAAALVYQGVDVLDGELDVGAGRLWHHPWAVYLGTLVVWGVWYARPQPGMSDLPLFGGHDDEDEIIWDPAAEMKALLEMIGKAEPEMLLQLGYKNGISGAVVR
ncbi:hypothetical protein E8E12_003636 [Didymella heteroderae]|uniref:Xylanolytic transcriptional activator regulatory domain-containing protein n=1 Tax=Didymella heteroderae TaxID=1769908 RepID=A0A9P4WZ92_9PLEO|nr:hypothetical protein E8E12_003636 [Didymella heteroderae]